MKNKNDCVVSAPPIFDEEKAYKDFLLKKENLKNYYRPFSKTTLSCIDGCVGYNPVLDKFIVNVIDKKEENL